MARRIFCCVLLLFVASAHGASDAISRFAQLRGEAKEAREKGDRTVLLHVVLDLAQFLHHSGPSEEQLALTYSETGDAKRALKALRDFVRMGQSDDGLMAAPQLRMLHPSPEFRQLMKQMQLNKSPVQHAVGLTELNDPNLVPEDIDYDAETGTFLVASVLEKKIIRVGSDSTQKDFATAPDGWRLCWRSKLMCAIDLCGQQRSR